MNKYVLMLAAAGLIAAAPAYYAFQAQAEEAPAPAAAVEAAAPAPSEEAAAPASSTESTPEEKAAGKEPAAGEPAPAAPSQAGNE